MKLTDIISYALILLFVILLRSYVITPVIVSGTSMNTTLDDGDLLLLKKYDKKYERFDIVVFDYGDSKLVKRVIGLPGEYVKYVDGILYINGDKVDDPFSSITKDYYLDVDEIPDGYYFVLGDNRNNSVDSRIIGLISAETISGTTTFSLWPLKTIK